MKQAEESFCKGQAPLRHLSKIGLMKTVFVHFTPEGAHLIALFPISKMKLSRNAILHLSREKIPQE